MPSWQEVYDHSICYVCTWRWCRGQTHRGQRGPQAGWCRPSRPSAGREWSGPRLPGWRTRPVRAKTGWGPSRRRNRPVRPAVHSPGRSQSGCAHPDRVAAQQPLRRQGRGPLVERPRRPILKRRRGSLWEERLSWTWSHWGGDREWYVPAVSTSILYSPTPLRRPSPHNHHHHLHLHALSSPPP